MTWLAERRLAELSSRLRSARDEMQVLEEQLDVVCDEADDLRIRAMVSETPLASAEHTMGARQRDAYLKARDELTSRIADLQRKQDELLDRFGSRFTSR